jgi:SAM-dependent methyltransferase
LEVWAVDRDSRALKAGREASARAGRKIRWIQAELEEGPDPWRPEPDAFDGVLVVRYLWRPLLDALRRAVRPGGILALESFTRAQARLGPPRDPRHLLEPGEAVELLAGWEILDWREGPVAPPTVARPQERASVVARRPMQAAD